MNLPRYILAFTGARLQRAESVALAELFREDGDWDQVRRQAEEGNILQVRTLSSAKRVARELVFRLQELSARELELLVSGSQADQNHSLWGAFAAFWSDWRRTLPLIVPGLRLTLQASAGEGCRESARRL